MFHINLLPYYVAINIYGFKLYSAAWWWRDKKGRECTSTMQLQGVRGYSKGTGDTVYTDDYPLFYLMGTAAERTARDKTSVEEAVKKALAVEGPFDMDFTGGRRKSRRKKSKDREERKEEMKFSVTFKFEAGKETCASKPGKFCTHMRTEPGSFGTRYICVLFEKGGRCIRLEDHPRKKGWLGRCAECLEKAKVVE